MALLPLIEIEPLPGPVEADIALPGSKSITNRALVLAALSPRETTLTGALWSEDTQVMVECLQTLGYMVNVTSDPGESANRSLTVFPLGGRIPRGGSRERPLELYVGNSGTTARFLAALLALGDGAYRLSGTPRMHERPQAALFDALRQLGYQIDSPNDKLPVVIHGRGPRTGRCRVSAQESSQFASALLLCAPVGKWEVEIVGENSIELPYVTMTREMVARFPGWDGRFAVEPDASSGSYFWAAAWLNGSRAGDSGSPGIRIRGWPTSGWQIDQAFPRFWPLPETVSRERDLADSIMTAMIMAPFASRPVSFTELGRLRVQECERVQAMHTELVRCGAQVLVRGDEMQIQPGPLHGAVIETYNDHRVALCFGVLGLRVPGMQIKDPACVKKTFPNFFQKLAAAPPLGLGAVIRDAHTGKTLADPELLAE